MPLPHHPFRELSLYGSYIIHTLNNEYFMYTLHSARVYDRDACGQLRDGFVLAHGHL